MGISDRFREQRESLGLTQKAVAELVGSSLNTVNNWERGTSSPSAEAVAALGYAGADVLYIMTGQRTPQTVLTVEEATLLDNYHHADEKGKAAARAVLEAVSVQKQKAA